MQYFFLILFAGLVFGLCFLIDRGMGRLRRRLAKAPVVRPPLGYPILAAALLLAAIPVVCFSLRARQWLFLGVAALFLLFAGYAMFLFCSAAIFYTEDTFTLPGSSKNTYRYEQIQGQRVGISRHAVCLVLCLGQEELVLRGNMLGFGSFLEAAFAGWCRQKGLDPTAQAWHDPTAYQWFPDQVPPEPPRKED